MLKRITRKLAILAVLAGMLSGLAPSMLAVRTAPRRRGIAVRSIHGIG